MNNSENLKDNSDSLIGLLTSQCVDLEKLLSLAREETQAAQQGKFFKILDIVSERAEITKKLETVDPKLTTKAQNGQDIINYANGINGQYGFLLGQVEGNPVLTQGVKERLAELEKLWSTLRAEVETIETIDIAAFNKLLQASKVEGVIAKKKATTVM